MGILLMIHSIVRWLIVIVGAVTIIKFAIGWLGKGDFVKIDRGLGSSFSGLMDLQVLLGIVFLVWSGLAGAGFPRVRIEHAVIMIVAAVVAHLPLRWKEAAAQTRFRNSLFAILGSLILVFLGVALLPGGWAR